MPGPVSDAYDPEWGTAENADQLRGALGQVYRTVSGILGNAPPMPALDLVYPHLYLTIPVSATLTEREWRLIRFALERAQESV